MNPPVITALPKAASLADLARCLQLLGSRPLKLIADAVQPGLCESLWSSAAWKFSYDNTVVSDKNLLPFPEDAFQFSLANERSKQDFHRHASVLEIYASSFSIELLFENEGRPETLSVPSGVVIVPPGVSHRVTLHGLTFVFQVAVRGGQVHNDRTIVEPPGRG